MRKRFFFPAIGLSVLAAGLPAEAIEIVFDYRYDSGYISNNQDAVDTLNAAADFFAPLEDDLSAIVPGTVYNEGTPAEFQDEWTATFTNPATNNLETSVDDLTIPENSVYIFVGSRDLDELSEDTLGAGAAGGFSAFGIADFVDAVTTRGQENISGPTATDYAVWGGSVAFDTTDGDQPRNWHWDANTLPGPGQADFLSTAIHEILHVVGFAYRDDGTAPDNSFTALIDAVNNQFIGTQSQAVNGGPVLLEESMLGRPAHWAEDTASVLGDGVVKRPALMTPDLAPGERQVATLLDYAAMADIGWEVPDSILNVPVLPGDYNLNGVVDAADYTVWRDGLGSDLAADDYDVWVDHFGEALAGAEGGVAVGPVPEPAAVVLMCVGLVMVGARRRVCSWIRKNSDHSSLNSCESSYTNFERALAPARPTAGLRQEPRLPDCVVGATLTTIAIGRKRRRRFPAAGS